MFITVYICRMIIGFLSNKLTLRGTEVNLYDYADCNENILGNHSIIITRPYDYVIQHSPRDVTKTAYDKFTSRFQVETYINPCDVEEIIKRNKIDILFIEKAGSPTDGLVFTSCKTIIHSVFTTNEPHGTLYTSISDSLNQICKTNVPVLPYMVRVHDTDDTLRSELGIPEDAIVFGSYSGADEYTNEDVKRAVSTIVHDERYKNIYFIYMNIVQFGPSSPRLKFLPGSTDMRRKRMFINTCNAMLYARNGGETFGLACGEFSICNKPVIASPGQHSNAHEQILGDDMIPFKTYEDVLDILTTWPRHAKDVSKNGYKQYTPHKVMEIFNTYLQRLIPTRVSNAYPNSLLFVTAFKNIGRDKWHIIPRTVETYCSDFLNLVNNLDYKLLVYVEDDMFDYLKQMNLRSTVQLIHSKEVYTFYDEYIENEREMISSDDYQAKVTEDRKGAPEHWCADYTMVNHSKINYVRDAKARFPAYEYYSWIDFGCIRNTIEDVPKNIDVSKLSRSIMYLALMQPPAHTISAEAMVRSHDVYLAGSQFVVHTDLVETMYQLYKDLLETWKRERICDDDQGAILQLYFANRHYFQLYSSPEWFSLFRNHLNSHVKLETKYDIHKIIQAFNLTGTYVEIGVARGVFTEYILNNTGLTKYLLVDPYKNFTLDEYTDGMNYYNMDEELRICKDNLSKYSQDIQFIRKTSSEAAHMIADESIDVVYIDGNHAYDYVMEDMRTYWSKIRSGGVMFGDDLYEYSDDKDVVKIWDGKSLNESISFGKYGVHAALLDFCKEMKLGYTIFSNQFMILKP